MKSFFDIQSPFFRPVWRRVLVVALTLIWAGVEAMNGQFMWAAGFAAAGLWCAYQFFIAWTDPKDERKDQ